MLEQLVADADSVWAFAQFHTALVDDNYKQAKRLLATWRVLVGLWRDATPGVEQKTGENAIRRVLRLRAEAARDLAAHLQRIEGSSTGGDLVQTLRSTGARLAPSIESKQE